MACNRLSHSAAKRFTECPKSYEYHYLKGYRGRYQSAALLFGTALDKSVEDYLQHKDVKQSHELLDKYWNAQKINDVVEELPENIKIVYANGDLDLELLSADVLWGLEVYFNLEKPVQDVIAELYEKKEKVGFDNLHEDHRRLINRTNWECLLVKGHVLLDKAIEVLDKNVEEVLGTQIKVEMQNEQGDSIIGYVDFVVRWKGRDKPVIIDLKTSSREYPLDSVLKSNQLALYTHVLGEKYEGTRTAGYLVMSKHIRKNKIKICASCGFDGSGARFKTCNNEIEGKRCDGKWNEKINPTAAYQVIIDDIPPRTEEITIENMDVINQSIKTGLFPRNFDSCIKYGSVRCPFYGICHGNTMEGVIEKVDKKEEK